MEYNLIRHLTALIGGAIFSFIEPTLPCAMICTAMVVTDCITAWRLSRRVKACVADAPADAGKLSSRRLGRVLVTLARIYVLLLLAHGIDVAIGLPGDITALRFAAGAVCFRQALSILENEAAMNDAPWAAQVRRWLIDKARRHL